MIVEVTETGELLKLVRIIGRSTMTADLTVEASAQCRIRTKTQINANLRTKIGLSARIATETDMRSFLRRDLEPNLFLSARINSQTQITASLRTKTVPFARIATQTTISARLTVSRPETDEFILLIDIFTPSAAGRVKTYAARLKGDGVEIPIKSYSYNAPPNFAGASLQCVLVNAEDRALIETADAFKFEIFDNGTWFEIFDLGMRANSNFSFSYNSQSVNFSSIAPIAAKLEQAPPRDLIIYDGNKDQLNQADFENVYDTDGNVYTQQLLNIPNLTLFDLLQIVLVQFCGFSAFHCTIPNYSIRRADFQLTGSFLDGIAPHLGMFQPLIYVIDNDIWIHDGSAGIPPGFPAPLTITAAEYESGSLSVDETNLDGFKLQYSVVSNDYDYTTQAFNNPPPISNPDGTELIINQEFREYRRLSAPAIVVRKEMISETRETRKSGDTITLNSTTKQFDSYQRITRTVATIKNRIPDLGNNGIKSLIKTSEIENLYLYKPDKFDTRRQTCYQIQRIKKALIAIDDDNKYIGDNFDDEKPYKQDFIKTYRFGNLKKEMTTDFVTVENIIQTREQMPNGQVEIATQYIDLLQNVSEPPTIEAETGDNSINAQTSATRELIVLRADGATRTNKKIQPLAVGELPLYLAKPLARRLLSIQNKKRGNLVLFGIRREIKRGQTMALYDADETLLGNFLVESFSYLSGDLGTGKQKTRTSVDIKQI